MKSEFKHNRGLIFKSRSDKGPLMLSSRALFLLVPLIFVVMLVVFWATRQFWGWPSDDQQRNIAVYIALGFSVLPVLVYVFNFLSQSQAAVGIKALGADVEIDFSKSAMTTPQLDLSSNIFAPGTYGSIAHSGSEEVIKAISKATSSPVVTLDLKDGRAWWATRLLALSAGAVQFGSPEVIVFAATRENVDKTFIGWAEPRPIFDALIRSNTEYESQYLSTKAIFNQLSLFYQPDIPPTFELADNVQNYQYTYEQGREYSFLQILMDQLRSLEPPVQEPVWMTMSLLFELFGHCLYTQFIELSLPGEKQVEKVLNAQTSYIPLVREGQFVGMIRIEQALKAIMKQLIWT